MGLVTLRPSRFVLFDPDAIYGCQGCGNDPRAVHEDLAI
jgi:hypothetical protein